MRPNVAGRKAISGERMLAMICWHVDELLSDSNAARLAEGRRRAKQKRARHASKLASTSKLIELASRLFDVT